MTTNLQMTTVQHKFSTNAPAVTSHRPAYICDLGASISDPSMISCDSVSVLCMFFHIVQNVKK